jgi:hypothetical protein
MLYTINTSQVVTAMIFLPDYEPFPNNCQLGDVTFQVELDPVSLPFPTFISEIPTTWIEFGTTDLTAVGVYNFKLIAIDSLTGQ